MSAERTTTMTFQLEEINLIVKEMRHPRHRIHLGRLSNDYALTELAAIAAENKEFPSQKRFTRYFTRPQLEILHRAAQFGELAKRHNLRAYLQMHLEKFDQ